MIETEQAVFGPPATASRLQLEHAYTGEVVLPRAAQLPLPRTPVCGIAA